MLEEKEIKAEKKRIEELTNMFCEPKKEKKKKTHTFSKRKKKSWESSTKRQSSKHLFFSPVQKRMAPESSPSVFVSWPAGVCWRKLFERETARKDKKWEAAGTRSHLSVSSQSNVLFEKRRKVLSFAWRVGRRGSVNMGERVKGRQ